MIGGGLPGAVAGLTIKDAGTRAGGDATIESGVGEEIHVREDGDETLGGNEAAGRLVLLGDVGADELLILGRVGARHEN